MPPVKEDNGMQKLEGMVATCKGNGFFDIKTKIGDQDYNVLCRVSGKMRKHNITVVEGDNVEIEVSPGDISKGRITYRKR